MTLDHIKNTILGFACDKCTHGKVCGKREHIENAAKVRLVTKNEGYVTLGYGDINLYAALTCPDFEVMKYERN